MNRLHIIIPTCDRALMLRRLLSDIEREGAGFRLLVRVFDDASMEVPDLTDFPFAMLRRMPKRCGKQRWWRLVKQAFHEAHHAGGFDYLFFLPDDVELRAGFFRLALETWEAIRDERKVALSLLVDERAGSLQWVPRRPQKVRFGEVEVWHQHWLDMAFLAPPAFLGVLRGKIIPIAPTFWDAAPRRSSGVGRQISRRLASQGWNVYSVTETLLYHGDHDSVMHPAFEGRAKRPLALRP